MEGVRVSKLFIYDPETQHHQGVDPRGIVMDRSEEIPKTEPAEEIVETKIEHVSEDESANSRFDLSPIEISEIIQSLIENPGANFGATANKFSERFQKRVTHATVYELYQDWCKRVNSSNCSTISNEESVHSGNDFHLVDEHILKIFDGSSQEELTAQFIRNQAKKIANHLGLVDFNASPNWLSRFLERHNRSLGIVPQRLAPEKRKPFVRLSFGEKHIISKFIISKPKLPVRAYAEHFSNLFNKSVTQKQIEVTKENVEKWADECYAGSSQSYEKFNRRASTRLTKSEREDIAQFLALQPTVTLEETARTFSKKWGKNVNRTHIARIKQSFKTAEQILYEDMVASIAEDYQENTSRPTMVPQYSTTERFNQPVSLYPFSTKQKRSSIFNDAPTLIQTISDDSEDEKPEVAREAAFKYSSFSAPTRETAEIVAPASQILRCPQCAVLLETPDEFWSHLRSEHYSILYSNACQPHSRRNLTPDS